MENLRTNNEISNFSEEIISEKDLPSYLASLEMQALLHIQSNDISNGLLILKRCEEIMESISAQGGILSSNLVISILHNISYCYQENQETSKLLTYIDACFFNVKTLDFIKGKVSLSEDRIRRFKFASKLCLQCSNIFYSSGQKKKSLKFASEAYKNSCKALQETFEICKKYQMQIQNKPRNSKLSKSEKNKLLLIERALPTLETVHGFLVNGSLHKVGMRSALGVKGDPDWVSMFNLNELMTLVPVKSTDFTQGMGIQAEFTKDYLFYKIGLLALSMHVLGLRHVSLGNKELGQKFCVSASKLLKNFFSENSPIVQEIQSFSCFEASENSPGKQKRIKRNKSLSFNLAKINVHSSSFTKFRSIYEKSHNETHKPSPKKKVKRNVSFTSNVFREMKKRSASSELKLNVE